MNDIGKMTACPKCGLEAKTLLHPFCQHKECPIRDAFPRKQHAQPSPVTRVQIKTLDWYEPTDHPQDDADNSILVAHGIGGRYHISVRQLVRIQSPDNMGYLLWGAKDGDEFTFTEHLTIDAAKASAQADFDAAVRACITETRP